MATDPRASAAFDLDALWNAEYQARVQEREGNEGDADAIRRDAIRTALGLDIGQVMYLTRDEQDAAAADTAAIGRCRRWNGLWRVGAGSPDDPNDGRLILRLTRIADVLYARRVAHNWRAMLRIVYWRVVRRYPTELCQRCGRPVRVVFHAPDWIWELATGHARFPDGESAPGVLCPPCVDEVVEPKLGGDYLRWTCGTSDERGRFAASLRLQGEQVVTAAFASSPEILDACCGGRMWWWDKAHPLAVYMDVRYADRGSVGAITGRPEWNPSWECKPDMFGDFRAMPFRSGSFQLVVFDPPHIVREKQPPEGINGLKYGALHPDDEQEALRLGFIECWRVLRPGGTLVFKWADKLARVEPHFPATPIVGTRSPRGGQTRWFIFYKPLEKVASDVAA